MPMPPMLHPHRLVPFSAQARPLLIRATPAMRSRHMALAAPANRGSSSPVADRQQEQASSTTERASSTSSPPPPRPPPPPPPPPPARESEQQQQRQRQQQPEASTSNSQQQETISSNKALEIERPWRRRLRKAFSALPLSIFTPYENLPADGRTQTLAEEACDPMERNCQIPMHVWESPCGACQGSGSARSGSAVRAARGRGRVRSSFSTTYSTCVACSGVGYVRYTTARLGPPRGLNGRRKRGGAESGGEGSLGPLTLARPAADEDDDRYIYSDSDSDDEEEGGSGSGSYSASYSDDEES